MSGTVRHDIKIQQGATFIWVVNLEDENEQALDLTGATARMTGRKRLTDTATLFALTSGAGNMVVDATAGSVTTTITAAVTAAYTFDYGVYDLEVIEADGTVLRVVEGVVQLSKEVTR
tara:strand:+ start:3613 stop:3966 length:354 start_codon:yes stop_codon:yes gene_type:complete